MPMKKESQMPIMYVYKKGYAPSIEPGQQHWDSEAQGAGDWEAAFWSTSQIILDSKLGSKVHIRGLSGNFGIHFGGLAGVAEPTWAQHGPNFS